MEGTPRIRISDADRERAAQRLHTAMAEGRISFAELDERLTTVYAARYAEDLQPPLADLPPEHPPAPSGLAVVPPATPTTWQPAPPAGPAPVVLKSGMGDIKRTGAWQVPPVLEVQSTMGDAVLDFTRAVLPQQVVEVRVKLGAGTARFILPDGATADVDGVSAGMGSVKSKVPAGPQHGQLHLVVRGKVSMGDVVVRYPYEVGRFRF
ncbi:DUF1707 SHOCT-like domain-containing protein [Klenkia taihuensis]|uniref:DUF1707 domain-containing protein n=1 Tax=Klenkia taihuensis TaxID=1225127 RepID=A0A1I1I327_9ACTN|nr:DUF1707 domain-containing protein [Klenkia taihuensis]GHE08870.1 hypothetical protein GCM10011381_11200 [Klenkia taihuensis]SFC30491.1 protein of unknown function [Klenkia taihuensis]